MENDYILTEPHIHHLLINVL